MQTYRYDPLDRITEAIEKVDGTQTWKQIFGYDIYGNRNARYQIVGSNVLPINNVTLPSVVSTTNRFTSGQGYAYDPNGNITGDVDTATGQNRTFTFNGDNKQTDVRNSSNITVGTYFYDGTGVLISPIRLAWRPAPVNGDRRGPSRP